MLSCNLGRQSASSSLQRSNNARIATCRRKVVVVRAFKRSETDKAAAAAVQCIAPSSNLHTYEQAVVTFGQVRVTPTTIGDHFSFMQLVLLLKVCSRYLLSLAACKQHRALRQCSNCLSCNKQTADLPSGVALHILSPPAIDG
jgi:hypothetical protein